MAFGNLVPRGRRGRDLSIQERDPWSGSGEVSPFLRLHQEMNRLFDDVFRGFDTPAFSGRGGWPNIELEETDAGYRVTAELPGLDEKDIDVSIEDGVLTIRGEKKAEAQDRSRTMSERYYGRFERRLSLGSDIDEGAVQARFERGVLSIDLPRSAKAAERSKRIPINAEGTKH